MFFHLFNFLKGKLLGQMSSEWAKATDDMQDTGLYTLRLLIRSPQKLKKHYTF
uniref:Uncharacterized protein n=1 Tax=Arundo donax TaxID=35708 RepID=A0A0A9AXX5_ARUDO